MLNTQKLLQTGFFKEIPLTPGDILFFQGQKDSHLYIILSGELAVEKSFSAQNDIFRLLNILKKGDIIGENALTKNTQKEVQIRALSSVKLLKIEAKKDFKAFLQQYPELAYELLLRIIEIGNIRLLESNIQLTAHHEISKAISEIEVIDFKAIYHLLEVSISILKADHLMYLEKNTALPGYYKLRYNTLKKEKIENTIIELPEEKISTTISKSLGIPNNVFYENVELKIGLTHYGYIIIMRNKRCFLESEKRLLENIASSIVGVIHQKQIQDEQKNISHIKEY